MADEKWSAFPSGGSLETGDIIVGLRGGSNYQFNAPLFDQQVVDVTGTTQQMAPNTIYVANNAGLVTLTLPLTAAFGSIISVVGYGSGGWKIAQNASNQIIISPQVTTLGTGGSLASSDAYDSITLICIVQNFIWNAFGSPQSQGLTFV